jgi:hypothetical protein
MPQLICRMSTEIIPHPPTILTLSPRPPLTNETNTSLQCSNSMGEPMQKSTELQHSTLSKVTNRSDGEKIAAFLSAPRPCSARLLLLLPRKRADRVSSLRAQRIERQQRFPPYLLLVDERPMKEKRLNVGGHTEERPRRPERARTRVSRMNARLPQVPPVRRHEQES